MLFLNYAFLLALERITDVISLKFENGLYQKIFCLHDLV